MSFRPGLETIRFHRFRIEKLDSQWKTALRDGTAVHPSIQHPDAVSSSGGELEFRTAYGRQDLEASFRLLHQRYCAAGLSSAFDKRMRILPFHFWPQTQVFVASQGSNVVGCISLITDSGPNPLPIESMYPESLSSLRRQGERTGEITCLALDPSCPASSSKLFGELTRRMMFFARAVGLTRVAAVVHPRHAKFYRQAMGFEIIGEMAEVSHVEGQLGVPILGTPQDPTPYREKWRQFYFDGSFPAQEIERRPMSQIDREYFRRHLVKSTSGRQVA